MHKDILAPTIKRSNDKTIKRSKAVVLAAGYGTRLRPFTSAVPKPLLPVWGEPMLARVVDWLREQGVDDIVVNCHYLHEQIEDWCAKNGCRAIYEPEILGTGGVLNPLRDWIGDDDFWLVNGDIVFELGVESLELGVAGRGERVAGHETRNSKLETRNSKLETRNAKLETRNLGYCVVSEDGPRTIEVEPDGNLVTNWHSPDPGWNGTWTYCGIALLKAKVLEYVKPSGFSSIIEAYEAAMMDGWFMKAIAPKDLLWTDAGTVDSYIALNQDGNDNAFAEMPQIAAALGSKVQGPRLKVQRPSTTDLRLSTFDDKTIKFLGARGSDRAFFKTKDAYIIIYDDAKRPENARYAGHARWLKAHGIKVPEVLADCPAMKVLALENAGAEDLKERSRTRGEDRLYDYVAVVEELAKFNGLLADASTDAINCVPPAKTADAINCVPPAKTADAINCIPPEKTADAINCVPPELEPAFDAALYKWERDLFAEHCLGTRFHMEMPEAVEKELEAVADRLLQEPPALVHRDFQSTNVIWKVKGQRSKVQSLSKDQSSSTFDLRPSTFDDEIFSIIDFQGMRKGAAAYDLASLLYDPYVDLREGERRALAALYAKKAGRPEIAEVLPFAAVERLVQALGAFGRLASVGKPEFGKYVLPALQNLLAAADDAGLDAVGALAEDLIAREGHGHNHHHHDGCTCGHHHHPSEEEL